MYKKIAVLSVLVGTLNTCASSVTPWIEIKPSYFLFTSSVMNDIYTHGGFQLQASATVPLWVYLDFYGSVGYRRAAGHALNTGEKTTLTVVPFDVGLKTVVTFLDHYYYFFAAGPRIFAFHQHNNSPYVDPKINGCGIGFFVNTGFNFAVYDCFLVGVFGEYSYEKKAITPKMPNVYSTSTGAQMGGLAFGVSLGYEL